MKNLFEETVAVLNKNGKSINDIIAVQGDDFAISVDNFVEVAKNTNYYSGYGHQEVACDLAIIGNGWWLERREYDGAEWWKFCSTPVVKTNIETVKTLSGDGWSSLKQMQ